MPIRSLLVVASALALALLIFPFAASASTGASSDLSNVFSDLSNSANGQVSSLFQWKAILTFVMTVVVPLVAIIGVVVLLNRLKDNPEPGNIIFSIATIVLVAGVAIAVVVLPGKINAASGLLLR